MNTDAFKRFFHLILLAVFGLAVFGVFGALIGPNAGPAPSEQTAAAGPLAAPTGARTGDGEFYLTVDTGVAVGPARFTYKGIANAGSIRIDVVIPEMDPEMAYVHLLDIPSAKDGFKLLGRLYKLTAVNKHRIRIVVGDARMS